MVDHIDVGDGRGILTDVKVVVHRFHIQKAVLGRVRVEVWGDPEELQKLHVARHQHCPFALTLWNTRESREQSWPAVVVHYLDPDVPNNYIMQLRLL